MELVNTLRSFGESLTSDSTIVDCIGKADFVVIGGIIGFFAVAYFFNVALSPRSC